MRAALATALIATVTLAACGRPASEPERWALELYVTREGKPEPALDYLGGIAWWSESADLDRLERDGPSLAALLDSIPFERADGEGLLIAECDGPGEYLVAFSCFDDTTTLVRARLDAGTPVRRLDLDRPAPGRIAIRSPGGASDEENGVLWALELNLPTVGVWSDEEEAWILEDAPVGLRHVHAAHRETIEVRGYGPVEWWTPIPIEAVEVRSGETTVVELDPGRAPACTLSIELEFGVSGEHGLSSTVKGRGLLGPWPNEGLWHTHEIPIDGWSPDESVELHRARPGVLWTYLEIGHFGGYERTLLIKRPYDLVAGRTESRVVVETGTITVRVPELRDVDDVVWIGTGGDDATLTLDVPLPPESESLTFLAPAGTGHLISPFEDWAILGPFQLEPNGELEIDLSGSRE